jgi:hypothetical protein
MYPDEVAKRLDPPFEPEKALTFSPIPQPPGTCSWHDAERWLTEAIDEAVQTVDEPERAPGIDWLRALRDRVSDLWSESTAEPANNPTCPDCEATMVKTRFEQPIDEAGRTVAWACDCTEVR